jgi:hypothetical protein
MGTWRRGLGCGTCFAVFGLSKKTSPVKSPREYDDLSHEIRHLTKAIASLTAVLVINSKPTRARFDVAFGLPTNKAKENTMVETTITNEQKVNVTLSPKTDTGKPAKLDGAPVWSVVSGDSTVVASADGLSADLVSSDTPGDTVFLVDGDADLGSGVEDIQETITLHVSGANAKNLGIAFGTPVAK